MLKEAVLRVNRGGGRLGWRRFTSPLREYSAVKLDEVLPLLDQVECDAARGELCVGFIAYEAASAFDPKLQTHAPSTPLARFACFDRWDDLEDLSGPVGVEPLDWNPEVSADDYGKAIHHIRSWIERGDTYQANYTLRLRASGPENPWELFRSMASCPRTAYSAFLLYEDLAIASASPELFLELEGRHLRSAPMKGTARRGRFTTEDLRFAADLAESEKDRAENLMIADMVRNDLGRIADVGTVRVDDLFRVERYATVHQMVTSVVAETDAGLRDVFGALFPPASMTGAPKCRTMEILAEDEVSPRGVYSGCIGTVGPGRSARFGVAIRTVVGNLSVQTWEFGVGGGIVWDSTEASEAAEWMTKASILTPPPQFDLLETIAWMPDTGYVLLDRHVVRLLDSGAYFDFAISEAAVRSVLEAGVAAFGPGPRRVRLSVSPTGECRIEDVPWIGWPAHPRVALAQSPIDSADRFFFHKTTRRAPYESAKAGFPKCDEVILWNREGEVTEGTFSNVAYQLEDRWFTPPLASGLIPGVRRAEMLETGLLEERPLRVDALGEITGLSVINSVRGVSANCEWVARGEMP